METSAARYLPESRDLTTLRAAAAHCRGCDLWQRATQTVFGEGPSTARSMLVGEQPGDSEDREGSPFVGPAGRLLDRALELAGIERSEVYLTNAVKHFKWEERGKRRLHKRPTAGEVAACRPWLEAEADAVSARVVVALGSTAASSLLGPKTRVTRDRGRAIPWREHVVVVTVHPSAVLRVREEAQRHAELESLVADLVVGLRLSRSEGSVGTAGGARG